MIQIVGFGLVAAFLALVLKEQKANFAFLVTLMVGAGIFLFLIDKIGQILTMLQRLAINANVNMVYVETLLKIIGIAYIAEFGAQITRDAGQGAIASKIELGGKILILVMAIPILTVIIETVLTLIPK
ncbi:stage III sporulation protein AD [Fictibacillus sp. 5RED26]|nr:stage III sporulation protein AD [Fictibacillus sp. 5RED26]MBH0160158.1 stage III sporulation protein AD [Fictibacillus sp. 26RED30]MBH0166449.1 stage III sporulation protein AD [Fictibacillus sp. 7GRE50]MBH0168559.1 stage III sporulation protein AD [Fictibacillus sp. 18YEL24]MBH0174541.1 stage III sporulation protein AD [Fictibacillus sp. 23RED33]MQR95632.1 stage III sporulation protein AD [Fictibacillus phosphorivorans]